MHRARVFGSEISFSAAPARRLADKFGRVLAKSLEAAIAAEVVGLASMAQSSNRVCLRDGHPTDRVENSNGFMLVLVVLMRRHFGLQPHNAGGGIALQVEALPDQTGQRLEPHYLANWPGFASNFVLQLGEQK
jgi:hypothetical protein